MAELVIPGSCWDYGISPGIWDSWASAHRANGSADPPVKMDEKLKSENMQKEQFSEWGNYELGVGRAALC